MAVMLPTAFCAGMTLPLATHALATELAGQRSQDERWRALADLLTEGVVPARVECFDISHTQGEGTVASCVVFGPEGPLKKEYRRFNITGVAAGDDYGALRQAIERIEARACC